MDTPYERRGIPKTVFQTCWTKEFHPRVAAARVAQEARNPEWQFILFDDREMEVFVRTIYGGRIWAAFQRLKMMVARADFWRYLVLYRYGGVYLDMDSYILEPLDDWIHPNDSAIITGEGNPYYYVQWALAFEAGHPLLRAVIEKIVQNIETERFPTDVMRMTGPAAFSEAIEDYKVEHNIQLPPKSQVTVHTDITADSAAAGRVRLFSIDWRGKIQYKDRELEYYLNAGRTYWRNLPQIVL